MFVLWPCVSPANPCVCVCVHSFSGREIFFNERSMLFSSQQHNNVQFSFSNHRDSDRNFDVYFFLLVVWYSIWFVPKGIYFLMRVYYVLTHVFVSINPLYKYMFECIVCPCWAPRRFSSPLIFIHKLYCDNFGTRNERLIRYLFLDLRTDSKALRISLIVRIQSGDSWRWRVWKGGIVGVLPRSISNWIRFWPLAATVHCTRGQWCVYVCVYLYHFFIDDTRVLLILAPVFSLKVAAAVFGVVNKVNSLPLLLLLLGDHHT